jgi:hypothetical protein
MEVHVEAMSVVRIRHALRSMVAAALAGTQIVAAALAVVEAATVVLRSVAAAGIAAVLAAADLAPSAQPKLKSRVL